ncbi:MAG: hypothetical protein HW378_209 [Anaerolineales bacterium]|nr:hypothetical protein [Anaerolineales bacterium]
METETPIFPPADQQLALLEIEDLWPLLTEEQQRKRYTGEQFAKNQRLYRAIALLLGDGWSVIGIARELGCAEKLVRCIDSRESCVVSEVKSRFGRKFLQVAAKAVRRTDEQLPHMSGKDAGIVAGIFTEKGLMLMGELGEKAVVKGDGMSREEFAAWLAASVPGGPVIDVPPVPPTPVPTGADGRSPDSESGGIVLNGQESWLSAPAVASLVAAPAPESGQVAPATAGGAEAGATGTGGGGGLPAGSEAGPPMERH